MKQKKIAIIGIGCNYSGGIQSPDSFWELLKNVGDGVVDVPQDRWSLDKFYDENKNAPGKMYVKSGAFIEDDIFQFDSNFFGIAPREAKTLDPQQRILLETTFEAFEDAGLNCQTLKCSKTGVFIGGFMLDNFIMRTNNAALNQANSSSAVAGSATLLSNRISHAFDLLGPSLTVDTACSSSLVATHLACQSIIEGDSDIALAGGVNVMLNPSASVFMCKGGFLAKDGRSKSFFENADGYGRGEGAGVIILKEYSKAIADNDRIYAVIDGTAVNQDGRTEGIALPNKEAQKQVIADVINKTGVNPATIDYVETHGTGTKAGDPLELGALGEMYGQNRSNQLLVGSVKINIGHTEAAAGVAGMIKAALMLKHGEIVPHMNLGELNSNIPFEALNIKVPLQGENGYNDTKPLKIAVNSFGYGGTNGHAILSAHTTIPSEALAKADCKQWEYIFPLSAKSAESLLGNAKNITDFLQNNNQIDVVDLAYTLSQRKSVMDYNWMFKASSTAELLEQLKIKIESNAIPKIPVIRDDKNIWVYTGMGPQWFGMGQELYKSDSVFADKINECDELFQDVAGYSLLDEMLKDKTESKITENYLAQPANFFIQIALTHWLMSRGVQPDAVIGHSVGEIAAATVAGAISLEDGIRISYLRGKIVEDISGKGTLLAIGLGSEEASKAIQKYDDVEIATFNSPSSVALAGTESSLKSVDQALSNRGIFSKFVRVKVAYHSSQLEALKSQLMDSFSFIKPQQVTLPLYSTVTGKQVFEVIHNAEYWWNNVRNQVFFGDTIQQCLIDGFVNFVEIGPHPVLGAAIRENAEALEKTVNVFHCLKVKARETQTTLELLASLQSTGVSIALNPQIGKRKQITLPIYHWEKERLWEESQCMVDYRHSTEQQNPYIQFKQAGPYTSYKTQINRPALSYLEDHKVGGINIFPAAAYLETAIAAVNAHSDDSVIVIEDVQFIKALAYSEDKFPELNIQFNKDDRFEIYSNQEQDIDFHVCGSGWATQKLSVKYTDVAVIEQALNAASSGTKAYEFFNSVGLNYHHSFQSIDSYSLSSSSVYARLKLPKGLELSNHHLHPSLLDAAFQALLLKAESKTGKAYLPVKIKSLRYYQTLPAEIYCIGTLRTQTSGQVLGDIQLVSPDTGLIYVEIIGLECTCIDISVDEDPSANWLYKYTHEELKLDNDELHIYNTIIFTGCQKQFKERNLACHGGFLALDKVDHMPEKSQLVYLAEKGSNDGVGGALKRAHEILNLLQQASLVKNITRLLIMIENGLIDEASFTKEVEEVDIDHNVIVGVARVIMTEMPDISCKIIDLRADNERAVHELLTLNYSDEEIIVTDQAMHKGVLARTGISYSERANCLRSALPQYQQKLEVTSKGDMSSVVFRDIELTAPKANEIQISVNTTSINFKDVMKSLGMLNDEALADTYLGVEFGLEGAGVITELGDEVNGLQIGDRVYFMGTGMRTSINVLKDYVYKIPAHISFEEASTWFVYFTAWVGLIEQAQLKAGDKVLIHSAAGGVGIAACQLAMLVGAEIYATAGTKEKRNYLKNMGVNHVYDSRTLDCIEEIKHDSQGGVDVVLNSLAGRVLQKSFELLKTLGRFVEIGKQDITKGTQLSMAPFNKSIQFIALDLDKILSTDPSTLSKYFHNFLDVYSEGKLPSLPYEVCTTDTLENGFRKLASGNHIGKIVIKIDKSTLSSVPEIKGDFNFKENDSFIITGGCSGFGLRAALWLAKQGLNHIVLSSRRGYVPEQEQKMLTEIKQLGTQVYLEVLDVNDQASIKKIIEKQMQSGLILSGVIHAATVLDDSVIASLDAEQFDHSFLPKAKGAWNLHELTRDLNLEYFVTFSSVTSYLGNPGQLAYAASNCYLDGLTHYRNNLGLKSTCISWGSISEVGILTRDKHVESHLANIGLNPVPPAIGLDLMGKAMLHQQNHLGIIDINWNQWVSAIPGTWKRLSNLLEKSTRNGKTELVSQMFLLKSDEHGEFIEHHIKKITATILGAKYESLVSNAKLNEQGLDSLMSVEMTLAISKSFGVDIPIMEILGAGTIGQLSIVALEKIIKTNQKQDNIIENVVEPDNLLESCLQKICISRPYFSLTKLTRDGDTFYGVADSFHWSSDDEVNLAETARNLALLGSCAAAEANPNKNRHCYPVKKGDLKLFDLTTLVSPEDEIQMRANVATLDVMSSHCEVVTRLYTNNGERYAEMLIEYHIIPEEALYELFKNHINKDKSWQQSDSNAYEQEITLSATKISSDEFSYTLDALDAHDCVGHFKDLPAFPVSIMTRYIAKLVRLGHETKFGAGKYTYTHGKCSTENFAFAGQQIIFTAYFVESEKDQALWRGEVKVGNDLIAEFEFILIKNRIDKKSDFIRKLVAQADKTCLALDN